MEKLVWPWKCWCVLMRSVNSCLWVGGDCGGQEQKKKKKPAHSYWQIYESYFSSYTHTQRLEVGTKSEDTLMPLGLWLSLPFTPQENRRELWWYNGYDMVLASVNVKSSFTFVFTPGLSHGSWIPSKDWLWLNSTCNFVEISCRLMSRDEQKAE